VLVGAVMIRGIQYMSVTLNFNKNVKRDDMSIAVNILKELYTSQKNLVNGVSISDIYRSTSVADYDKIKKILYALEGKSIIRMDVEDQCYLNCDVFLISLRKIYTSLDPSLNFNTSSIRKVNAIKTQLYSNLDVKLHECF
jgi:membrane protein